ncbi:MAG: DUF423 domain-containing protein [Gemmatimonadales bacterium]
MRAGFLRIGIVTAGLAVALGAFGAHALKARLSAADLATFETGVRYQMYHGLALLAVALLMAQQPSPWLGRAGWAFTIGTVLFSGSLYTLVLSGQRWWGAVTPFGGVAFLAGWLCFGIGAWRAAGR